MKLTTAALVLFSTTFGATAFVPRAPFVSASRMTKPAVALWMSEAPTAEAETYE